MSVKESWEEFAKKVIELEQSSPRLQEAAQAYRKYLRAISPEERTYWMATPTYAPGRMRTTIVPRILVPLYLERFPEVRKRYRNLAEAYFKPPTPKTPSTTKGLPKSTRVVVCEPSFEPATRWGSAFIRRYISIPYREKHDIDSLWRIRDVAPQFRSRLLASEVVCGVGHGNETTYTGQFMTVLWKKGRITKVEAEGKAIKLLSCLCGEELGPDLIDKGAKTFQGYTEEYIFYMNSRRWLSPSEDEAASLFLKTYCDGVNTLLEGGTNQEAYDTEYSGLVSNAEKIKEDDPEVASALYHNAKVLITLGEPSEVI